MVHIKVITLRQLITAIAVIVLVLALAVFALRGWLSNKTEPNSPVTDSYKMQVEDFSACVGHALPGRSRLEQYETQSRQAAYLSDKFPGWIHLFFGVDPTDIMSIFAHAMPGASIAGDAVIQGLDTARIMQDGSVPHVTIHLGENTQSTYFTLRNRLFSAYRQQDEFRVFIYHSHTTEAYSDSTSTTGAWRSRNDSQNMVGVGDTLCEVLDMLGITVSHDRTLHETPNYNYAYSHSLQSLQREYEAHPETDLFIDVHRDAWIEGSSRVRAVTVEKQSCAQIQFVIGKGSDDIPVPHWRENAVFAEAITQELERIAPGITIPVRYVNAKYNQYVAPGCILVEVGHNENTLQEAHLAAEYLARAISSVLSKN